MNLRTVPEPKRVGRRGGPLAWLFDWLVTEPAAASTDQRAPTAPSQAAADPDVTIRQTLRLLADRAIARNPAHSNPTGHRKAIELGVRTDHLDTVHDLLDRDPSLTAEQLADLVDPPATGQPTATPEDTAVQAAAAQMERNAARTRGEACATCDGAYWLDPELLEDRTWGPARPCPTCNDEARTA